MPRVFQIACGDSGRHYDDLFIKYDVMFMGPGDPGEFSREFYQKEVDKRTIKKARYDQLINFTNEEYLPPDSIILLRRGYEVIAIGVVDTDLGYTYEKQFDDVYGWDLQHVRRVIWQNHLNDELEEIQKGGRALFRDRKQIHAFSGVNDRKILEPIQHLFSKCNPRTLKELPDSLPDPLSMEELGKQLFSIGLANNAIEKVIHAIQKQRRMINWYYQHGEKSNRPTEHEVVAHIILPLMLALGWSEQLLAVEWLKIDLAAFMGTPTRREDCVMIFEAKGLGQGLQHAYDQAKKYVHGKKLTACQKIVLTDGMRMYLHQKMDGVWEEQPSGYINFSKIRTNHIAPASTNAVKTLNALTPANAYRKLALKDE